MKAIKLYVGLDVRKNSITTAIAKDGRQGEIRLYGTITNALHALEKVLARIRKAHPGIRQYFYVAGQTHIQSSSVWRVRFAGFQQMSLPAELKSALVIFHCRLKRTFAQC